MPASNLRHASLSIQIAEIFPKWRNMAVLSSPLCETVSENVEYGRRWDTVTCRKCQSDIAFQRASAIYNAIAPKMHIPQVEIRIIYRSKSSIDSLDVDCLEFLSDWLFLPARYFLYIGDKVMKLNIEAWGSRDERNRDKYYRVLKASGVPFDVFRIGDEPSRSITVSEEKSMDIITGQTVTKWAWRRDNLNGS